MPVLDYQGDNRKNKEWNTSIIKLHSFRYRRRSSPRYVQIATSHTLVQVPSPHSSTYSTLLPCCLHSSTNTSISQQQVILHVATGRALGACKIPVVYVTPLGGSM